MNPVTKALTLILGAIAVLACIAVVGIIGYSAVHGNDAKKPASSPEGGGLMTPDPISAQLSAVPTSTPEIGEDATIEPLPASSEHVHDYKELVIREATCTEAGLIRYTCSCGDSYEVDIYSLGHLQDDEWELVRAATDTQSGLRVKKCIRCGETLVSETIPSTGTGTSSAIVTETGEVISPTPHNHLYVATTEREATCTLAGLRKLTCSCGDFYTEMIPALGHVASDWEEAEAPTATQSGTAQRVCTVCGALLDIKVLPKTSPSPSSSASAGTSSSPAAAATASGGGSSPGASAAKTSPSPSPTPHSHNFVSYVIVPATCTEKGIRSYVCSCGASYAESIELDLNNHKFLATFVAPTETQQGYTIYTCERCNYSYMDNYVLPLNPGAAAAVSQTESTAAVSPSPGATKQN